MRLGEHTVAVRRLVEGPDVDQYGEKVIRPVDTRVEGCLVVPASRRTGTSEPDDRAAPRIVGLEFYGPAGMDLAANDVVVWPVESFVPDDEAVPNVGTATGPTYQVDGDVGRWDESTEARLQRAA